MNFFQIFLCDITKFTIPSITIWGWTWTVWSQFYVTRNTIKDSMYILLTIYISSLLMGSKKAEREVCF